MIERDEEDLLARFAAVEDARALSESGLGASKARPSITAGQLIDYARRTDPIFNLAIERRIRENRSARTVYMNALGHTAIAGSPVAIAASGERAMSRMLGPHRMECIEDHEGLVLVIHLAKGEPVPSSLEVRSADGQGGRIALSKPIRGVIQFPLDRLDPAVAAVYDWIVNPDSAILLFP